MGKIIIIIIIIIILHNCTDINPIKPKLHNINNDTTIVNDTTIN